MGNVIRRPTLRQYEIPYLAQSLLPAENQISVEDLYISLRNDRIVLRSKKLNKEVKPYLTNAHNYYTNTLPVYHFLSDLYSQNTRSGLYFSWGGLEHIYAFLPRVEYDNIILSKARWKITEKDISSLELLISDKHDFLLKLKNWRSKRKIPVWIQWVKFDNTLTMNLENYDMAGLFIQAVRNEKSIIIEEFLYNENDDFKREFIFPMYKNK
nr:MULTISPECIES: lantibiotic dehydratase [Chryseobacterium]